MKQSTTFIKDVTFERREDQKTLRFRKLLIWSVALSFVLLTNVTGSLHTIYRHSLLVSAVYILHVAAMFRLWRGKSSLLVKYTIRYSGPFQWDPGIFVHWQLFYA